MEMDPKEITYYNIFRTREEWQTVPDKLQAANSKKQFL